MYSLMNWRDDCCGLSSVLSGRVRKSWTGQHKVGTRCKAGGTLTNILILGKICKYWNIGSVLTLKYQKSNNRSKTISVQL